MKFVKLLFLATFISFIFSCNNDDASNSSSADIVGNWKVTDISYTGISTTSAQGTTVSADFTGTGVNMDLEITFEENPNNYETAGDYSIDLTTMVQGQSVNSVYTNNDFEGKGSWDKDGTTLSFTDESGTVRPAMIIELTETTLKISQSYMNSEDQGGVIVTQNIDAEYIFKKQ